MKIQFSAYIDHIQPGEDSNGQPLRYFVKVLDKIQGPIRHA